jgi:HSP20 family protein
MDPGRALARLAIVTNAEVSNLAILDANRASAASRLALALHGSSRPSSAHLSHRFKEMRRSTAMAIQRWEPFHEMVSLRDAMGSLLQESFVRPMSLLAEGGVVMPPLDIVETENEFIVKASLPGVKPEDVQITAHGDTLTIRGEMKGEEEKNGSGAHYHVRERRTGSFQRTVTLSTPISADKAQASFENGVLTLTLPKAEEAKPKQIRINGTSAALSGSGSKTT